MSGKIVRTTNITQSAVGNKDGLWTTVFTAAVFINDDNPPMDTGKSLPLIAQASPQEEIVSQMVEGQRKNSEARDHLAPRQKEPPKAGIGPTGLVPSPRKSLS